MKKIFTYIKSFFKKEEPKQFNVKITKSSSFTFWYHKRIGEIHLVEESNYEGHYITIASNIMGSSKGYINKNECEIVK